jgi:hypothetical protein
MQNTAKIQYSEEKDSKRLVKEDLVLVDILLKVTNKYSL